MSKVAVKGNDSGTGVFTLEAPATNTDRTLTIPDSDGELLYTDSNGDLSVDGDTFFVDSANNQVGIGTSSPNSALAVDTSEADIVNLESSNSSGGYLRFRRSGTTKGYIGSSASFLGGGTEDDFGVRAESNFTIATSGGSEAARIDLDGRLLVGDTNTWGDTTSPLCVSNASNLGGGAVSIGNDIDTATRNCITFRNVNGQVGRIRTTATSTEYITSSDYRLKENVTDLSNGITRLKNLPVHRFNFIADPEKTVDGFLAHEVQPYVPEAISGEKDEVEAIGEITDSDGEIIKEGVTEPTELKEGQTWTKTGEQPVYQGIDQSKLVPLLTAALQEAVGKIEQQQTQIDDLLSRVTALETE